MGSIAGDLRDGLPAGLGQSHSLLFAFSRRGFLSLCHVDPLPNLFEYMYCFPTLAVERVPDIVESKLPRGKTNEQTREVS